MFKEIGTGRMLSTAVFHLYHVKKMNRRLPTGTDVSALRDGIKAK